MWSTKSNQTTAKVSTHYKSSLLMWSSKIDFCLRLGAISGVVAPVYSTPAYTSMTIRSYLFDTTLTCIRGNC